MAKRSKFARRLSWVIAAAVVNGIVEAVIERALEARASAKGRRRAAGK